MKTASGLLSVAASCALAVLSPGTLSAVSPNHTKTTFVENFDLLVPTAEGCSGEDVHVFGTIDGFADTTIDGRGGVHVVMHFQPHLQAVGLQTGLEYQAVGPAHIVSFVDGTGPSVSTAINITRLISPGSSDNVVLTESART